MAEEMHDRATAFPAAASGNQWVALWTGSAGLLVLGLQPILLGAVFTEGKVSFDGLALAATLEIIALGIASAVAAFWRNGVRTKAVAFLLLAAILNLLSAHAGGAGMFIVWRSLAGLAEGGLVAIATEHIARSAHPERSGGHFMILQTAAQCVLALLLSVWVIPWRGSAGGFEILALVSLASLAFVPLLPEAYPPLAATGRGQISSMLRAPPFYALGAIFFFFLFIGAIWAFLEPLGLAGGVSSRDVGLMVSVCLAVQVAGAVIATSLSGGRQPIAVLGFAGIAALIVCGLFYSQPGYVLFGLAVMATGFIWLFVTPFQIGMTVMADKSRGAALLVPAAQLFGAALGPVGASVFIVGENARAVPVFGAATLVVSLAMLLGLRRASEAERREADLQERAEATGWRNWSGSVLADPKLVARPRTVEELSDTIRTAPAPVRIAGSGHSFTPLVHSDGTILDLSAFSGLISHDPVRHTARIGAQTRLGDLTPLLRGIGQGLPNMGDIDKQAFAGALGTATHGSGLTLGAYHTQVESMSLIDGRGNLREIRRAEDPELLLATGVTLGAFGALTEVTIQNMPTYNLRRRRWIVPFEEIIDGFDPFMRGHRSAEFYFIPFSGHVLLLTCDISTEAPTARPQEDDEDSLATLKLLRTFLLRAPWLRRKLIGSALRDVPAEDYVQEWQNVYTSDRRTRFNEMEYHLPYEAGPSALREVVTMAERQFPEVYFPMEVRSVAPDEFWLSPFYRRPTCSIAIHHDAKEDPAAFMREAEKIFRQHEGRPHWGKMHNLTARDFEAIYPRFRDAMEVRRDFDPDNRFVSPYLRRLLGIES